MKQTTNNKKLKWAAAAVGFIIFSIIIFFWIYPPMNILRDTVRDALIPMIEEQTGLTVSYDRLDVAFFPKPSIRINNVHIAGESIQAADIPAVLIRPNINSILKGNIDFHRIIIKHPFITVNYDNLQNVGSFPFLITAEKGKNAAERGETPWKKIDAASVLVTDGKISVIKKGGPKLRFDDVKVEITPEETSVSFSSNSVKGFYAYIRGQNGKSEGGITLSRCTPEILSRLFLKDAEFQMGPSEIDAIIHFNINEYGNISGDASGEIPLLTMRRGKRESKYKIPSFKTRFELTDENAVLDVDVLDIATPGLKVTGGISQNFKNNVVHLVVNGKDTNIDSVKKAIAIFSKHKDLAFFNFVQKGEIPRAVFKTTSNGWDKLDAYDNFEITGELRNADVKVDTIKSRFTDMNGFVQIQKGVLKGKNISGTMGRQKLTEGKLMVVLNDKDNPYDVSLKADVDLAELHPYLQKIVKNKTLLNELAKLFNVEGHALGRLHIAQDTRAFDIKITAENIGMTCDYERIPFPLEIQKGGFYYDGKQGRLAARDFYMGTTRLSNFLMSAGDDEPYPFELTSGRMEMKLSDIMERLGQIEGMTSVAHYMETMTGTFIAEPLSVKGDLADLKSVRYDLDGRIMNFSYKNEDFSALGIRTGRISASTGLIDLTDAKICYEGDCFAGDVTGRFGNGKKMLTATLSGNLNRNILNLVDKDLPFRLKAPVGIKEGRITWDEKEGLVLNGDFVFDSKTHIGFTLAHNHGWTMIRSLKIRDEDSHANFTVNIAPSVVSITGNGILNHVSLNRIMDDNAFLAGFIEGNYRLDYNKSDPFQSGGTGMVKGEKVRFKTKFGPASAESFHLTFHEKTVMIQNLNLDLADHHFFVKGDIDRNNGGITAKLNVDAPALDYEAVKAFKASMNSDDKKNADKKQIIPIQAEINLKADYLDYGKFHFSPLDVRINYENEDLRLTINDSSLCGISLSGEIISGRENKFHLNTKTEKGNVAELTQCLLGMDEVIYGTYELQGEINGADKENQSKKEAAVTAGKETGQSPSHETVEDEKNFSPDLLKGISGTIRFQAQDGRINRFGFISKVFTLLNVGELPSDGIPALTKKGMAYNFLSGDIHLKDGKITVQNGKLDSAAAAVVFDGDIDIADDHMEMQFLLAPLKTVDWLVKITPITNDILNGALLTIPVKAEGSLKNPKISYISPAAVGEGLLGIMKRTFSLPVRLVKPIIEAIPKNLN